MQLTKAQLTTGEALASTVFRETYRSLVDAGWTRDAALGEANAARNRATERVKRLFARG